MIKPSNKTPLLLFGYVLYVIKVNILDDVGTLQLDTQVEYVNACPVHKEKVTKEDSPGPHEAVLQQISKTIKTVGKNR